MAIPIWKDKIVDLGADNSAEFRIRVGSSTGEIIYNGKAHKRPGETNIKIRVNDICADYLQNVLPSLSQAEFTDLSFPLDFYVESKRPLTSATWQVKEIVTFINDWSYDYAYDVATMGMAYPINGRIDARQWVVYTAYDAEEVTAVITYKDGTTASVIIPVAISDDFNADFNLDFARSTRAAGSGTAVFDLSAWEDVAGITINGKAFQVVTDCRDWALYYVNAYGGWDSLLIEGLVTEKDNLTRHTREMEYDNTDPRNRASQNYINEIEKVYTINTSWMSDDESSRMHHLLNSTDVYLCNINTGEMLPVNLTNTTTEHKTYKGNGARLVNYTFDAVLAHNRIRR